MNQPDSAGVGCTCGFYGSVVHSSDCVPVVEEPSDLNCCPHGEQLRGPCIECPGEVAQIRQQDSREFEKLLDECIRNAHDMERAYDSEPVAKIIREEAAYQAARAAVVSAHRRVEQWANVSDELNRANLEQAARITELEAELAEAKAKASAFFEHGIGQGARIAELEATVATLKDALPFIEARYCVCAHHPHLCVSHRFAADISVHLSASSTGSET